MTNVKDAEDLDGMASVNDADATARVEQLLAELDATKNIDEREELLMEQLASLEPAARHAYIRALATDAFEQSQDLCFILSQLSVALAGTKFVGVLNSSIQQLNETLEHLSITGGADERPSAEPATVTNAQRKPAGMPN